MFPTTLLLLLLLPSGVLAGSTQPNIVLMVSDDLGWADVPWHGSPAITPTLSSLVAGGLLLERHYAQPVCTPTRGALMTGKYPTRLGLQHIIIGAGEPWGLPASERLLPEFLKDLGYATHAVGKWHLGSCSWASTPCGRGFDTFYGYYNGAIDYYDHSIPSGKPGDNNTAMGYDFRNDTADGEGGVSEKIVWTEEYSMYKYAAQLGHIIENHDTDKPLFLYYPAQTPHLPLEVPQEYYEMYEGLVDDEDRRTLLAMMTLMDDTVDFIVGMLKERRMWENTVFVFLSDNGAPRGPGSGGYNFPLRGAKGSLWEGGVRTTAFINSPLLPPSRRGQVSEEMIHVTDWLPTITRLAACGVEDAGEACERAPALGDINGMDQLSSLLLGSPSNRTEILVNIDPLDHNKAIISGRWKLLVGPPGKDGWTPPPEIARLLARLRPGHWALGLEEALSGPPSQSHLQLYDILTDPEEREDLAAEHLDVVMRLLVRLNEHEAEALVPGNMEYDPASNPANFNGTWTPWMDSC